MRVGAVGEVLLEVVDDVCGAQILDELGLARACDAGDARTPGSDSGRFRLRRPDASRKPPLTQRGTVHGRIRTGSGSYGSGGAACGASSGSFGWTWLPWASSATVHPLVRHEHCRWAPAPCGQSRRSPTGPAVDAGDGRCRDRNTRAIAPKSALDNAGG